MSQEPAVSAISYVTDIYFGFGAATVIPGVLKKYGLSHPLLITDKGLIKIGIIERIGLGHLPVYDGVETNPTEAMVLEALAMYRELGCDGIIAVGGGSPMDLAKCVALLVNHPPPLGQYAILLHGISKITAAIPPIIAVPTTSGSGSEVGRAALITLTGGDKLGFLSNHLLPCAAVCDPGLTVGMPSFLTAATGMDALSHCVEAFCSKRYNPVADAIALDGLERGYRNILEATRQDSPHAREAMMMCSLQGGLAFQKGLGAVHSLSHPLGAFTKRHFHHGVLNAIFLPVVLAFNFDFCREKMEAMAARLNVEKARDLPGKFLQLHEALGLPLQLRELGLTMDDLMPLATKAKEDHCSPTNPRPLETEDCERLYAEAW